MTLQIRSLAIYNRTGKRRILKFRTGKVNIITGESKTGKSAIIGIVDYCLGRLDYSIPSGVIRENALWYVLHVQLPNTQAIIGRPAPQNAETTSAVYLEVGGELGLPEFANLHQNSNISVLIQFLTEAVGITANENVPTEGQSRDPLRANIKHAKFLLFQPQSRIADKNMMFYRQEEQQIPQAIKDSLPYFLGATGEHQYDRLQQLRRLRRERKILERRLADEQSLRGRDNSRATALIAEAQNVGLLPSNATALDLEDAVLVLRKLLHWSPTQEDQTGENPLALLQDERERLLTTVRGVQNEIESARSFASAQDGFTAEAADQKNRLSAIRLYREDIDINRCPLCESDLQETVPKADAIRSSLVYLERQMHAATRQRPRLDAFIADREDKLSGLRRQLTENKAAIEAIVAQEEVLQQERNRILEQAKVIGRVSLFLESVSLAEADDGLPLKIQELQDRIAILDEGLAEEVVEDRMTTILQRLGRDMSAWAKDLQLEFSDSPIGFELKNLTVVAHRESGPTRLPQMGSGENHMGYHIVTHLALHKLFVQTQRPVPSLLILDQPTQVYFPADPTEDRSLDDLNDEDRQAVRRLFKLIFEVTTTLAPHFQIIITDHADMNDQEFQDNIVERWRGGIKLIPADWYEQE